MVLPLKNSAGDCAPAGSAGNNATHATAAQRTRERRDRDRSWMLVLVVPAKARTHEHRARNLASLANTPARRIWAPAFAGTTSGFEWSGQVPCDFKFMMTSWKAIPLGNGVVSLHHRSR